MLKMPTGSIGPWGLSPYATAWGGNSLGDNATGQPLTNQLSLTSTPINLGSSFQFGRKISLKQIKKDLCYLKQTKKVDSIFIGKKPKKPFI